MIGAVLSYIKARWGSKKAQSMAEYALIAAVIAVAVAGVVSTLGGNIKTVFQKISETITEHTPD